MCLEDYELIVCPACGVVLDQDTAISVNEYYDEDGEIVDDFVSYCGNTPYAIVECPACSCLMETGYKIK